MKAEDIKDKGSSSVPSLSNVARQVADIDVNGMAGDPKIGREER